MNVALGRNQYLFGRSPASVDQSAPVETLPTAGAPNESAASPAQEEPLLGSRILALLEPYAPMPR
jgi:hypothetical protein